ncbi:MAG: addiction module toxin, HicA family [Nitrospira sp.]|nr:addiction module toxin, HicA family [Nitrospira sp.]
MTPRQPRATGTEVLKALQRAGFKETHVRGSHHYLRKEGGGLVVVPVHAGAVLPAGTMRSILRQAGMTAEELARWL